MRPHASIVLNMIVKHHIEHLEWIFRHQFKLLLLHVERKIQMQALPQYCSTFPINDLLDVQIFRFIGQVLKSEV